MKKKRGIILDIVLVLIAMIASFLVRLPSAYKDPERFFNTSLNSDEPTAELMDEFFTDEDNPYLIDPDSYYYAKQTTELIHESSLFSNFGKYNLLAFITAATYKFLNIFAEISLETIIVYIGPIIFSLSCIPAYIFIKKKTNRLGAFTAALLIGIIPILVSFSTTARFDTDILLTLLPTTMILSFILAIEAKTNQKIIINLSIATLSYLLLTFTWRDCLIYAYLAIFISLLVIFSSLIKDKFKIKASLARKEVKVALIFSSILLVISIIMHSHIEPILSVAIPTIFANDFPSPGSSVGELQLCPIYSGNLLEILNISHCGIINLLGAFPLMIAVTSLAMLFVQRSFRLFKKHHPSQDSLFLTNTVLSIWFFIGFFSAILGMRFIKNAAIPAALLAGLGIGILYKKFRTSRRGKILILFSWVLICLPSLQSYAASRSSLPSFDDAIQEASIYMNNNLNQDYAIASWWDLGYFYEYYTNLKPIANGGTYNSHIYYWLANAFLTKDETLSAKILKMLAKSKLEAPELAKSITGNYAKGSKLIKHILPMSKDDAKNTLTKEYGFSNQQADDLLNLTHQDAKVVVILTKDMLRLTKSMTHFGCLNFGKQDYPLEPACNDQNIDPEKKDLPYLLFRLFYEEENTENFKHLTKINDPLNIYSSNIWVIK